MLLCTYCITRRNIWSPPHFEWWEVWWKVQILSSWLLFPHGIGYVFIVSQLRNAPEPFKYFSFASRHWALSLEGTRESLQGKRFLLPGSGMLLARLLKLAPGFSSTSSWSTGNLPTIQLLPCMVVINKQRQQQPLGRFCIVHPGVNSFLLHPRGWISGKFQRADFQETLDIIFPASSTVAEPPRLPSCPVSLVGTFTNKARSHPFCFLEDYASVMSHLLYHHFLPFHWLSLISIHTYYNIPHLKK